MLLKLNNGKAGAESIHHEVFVNYGPIARIRTLGNCVDDYVYLPENDTVGNNWLVFANGPAATEAMFRAEGKYPVRFSLVEHTVDAIHKQNKWPSPMIFA